jgi:hypothetical protein
MPQEMFSQIATWMNDNAGLLAFLLFVATLLLGWASGIFAFLRHKPKFKLSLIEGPTFCCIYEAGGEHNGYKVHRVGFALYLRVANTGSAAASIEKVELAYHWNITSLNYLWLRYRVGWFWLDRFAVALDDFQVVIGDNVKIYPFLFQKTRLSQVSQDTYLPPGRSVLGLIYFEQPNSLGGCPPIAQGGKVRVKVKVVDTFGHKHVIRTYVPLVTLLEARRFNPSFGKTFSALTGEELPFDSGI